MLWDDWPISMISGSSRQLQQELEYTLLKPDCYSWLIKKYNLDVRKSDMQWNCVLNLEKISQKRMECFRLLFDHLAWIEHQFSSGIGNSRKVGSLWGMMRGVGGVIKSIHQSWLAQDLGLGLLYWGFKGVQEEIPWEEASTLQIELVAFPIRQYTSPQLHLCHRIFD